MKTILKYTGLLCLLLGMASCNEEQEYYTLEVPADQMFLTASSTDIVLTKPQEAETAVTFTWNEATNRGEGTSITYLFRMWMVEQTTNVTETIEVPEGERSISFTHSELNDILAEWNMTPGDVTTVEAEVIAQCPWATTGKTKNRKPNIITSLELKPEEMEKNNIRFQAKYRQIEEKEVRFEEINCEDADYLIVAFGSMARIGQKAMELAREEGIKVGILRPITLWPFPTKIIAAYADKVKGILVTELNAGQMIEDVRLAVNGKVRVEHFGRLGGIVPDPDEIVTALKDKIIDNR